MCQQRRILSHSRHKVTLFTLGKELAVYDWNKPAPQGVRPWRTACMGNIAGERSAHSRYLRIKMLTTNLEIQAKRV